MIEEISKVLMLHQLFAGEGGGTGAGAASGTGDGSGDGNAAGATVDTAGDDGRQTLRDLGVPQSVLDRSKSGGRLPSRMQSAFREGAGGHAPAEPTGKEATGTEDAPATGKQTEPEEGNQNTLNWDAIKRNPEFNAQIQSIIQSRLKEEGSASETLKTLAPVLQAIAQEKGVSIDVSDMGKFDAAGFARALQRDNSFFESKAAELGVTPEVARELVGLQDFKQDAIERQQEEEQRAEFQAHMNMLQQQAEELRGIIPDFDLKRELQDERFMKLTSPMAGISVRDAYFALHHDEIQAAGMAAATRVAQEKIANSVRANRTRPQENGGGGASAEPPRMHASKMSAAERANLKKQIYQAAAVGEKIYPT